MRKVQCSIRLTVLDGASLPEGVPEGGAVCVTGYADGRGLVEVLDAAVADAVEHVRAARSGEVPPVPKAHDLRKVSRPPWRCPCDSATFEVPPPDDSYVLEDSGVLARWCAQHDCPCPLAERVAGDSDEWVCPRYWDF